VPIDRNEATGKPVYHKGYEPRPLGADGPESQAYGLSLYHGLDKIRRGGMAHTEAPRWPRGSVGDGYHRYRLTAEGQKKAVRTREDWERAWRYIGRVFGETRPATVTLEQISEFRSAIADAISEREAHRAIKIWRALWQVLAALKLARADEDPSFGVVNTEPQPRSAAWTEWQIAWIGKHAWRHGYFGLAALLATAWDGMMSPVDARTVTPRQWAQDGSKRAIPIIRAKTQARAFAPLTRRANRMIEAYLAKVPVASLDGPLFRTRRGAAYTKNSLAEDFREIRRRVFPGDSRVISDIRRSGSLEAAAGAVDPKALADALGNSIAQSKSLQRTYTPAQIATVSQVPEARRRGRRAMRHES